MGGSEEGLSGKRLRGLASAITAQGLEGNVSFQSATVETGSTFLAF